MVIVESEFSVPEKVKIIDPGTGEIVSEYEAKLIDPKTQRIISKKLNPRKNVTKQRDFVMLYTKNWEQIDQMITKGMITSSEGNFLRFCAEHITWKSHFVYTDGEAATINSLSRKLNVDRHTVSNWINNLTRLGLLGIFIVGRTRQISINTNLVSKGDQTDLTIVEVFNNKVRCPYQPVDRINYEDSESKFKDYELALIGGEIDSY